MAKKLKEVKPKAPAIERLLEREIKALQKKIDDIEDLLDGSWAFKHIDLQCEIIKNSRSMKPKEAIAYLKEVEPQEKLLAKKAKQAKNISKLVDKQMDFESEKAELEHELERIRDRRFFRGGDY